MPSALTARIVDDETDTFAAFAWRCASQFFYDQKRAPDAVFEEGGFYKEQLERDTRELAAVLAMSDESALEDAKKKHVERLGIAYEALARAMLISRKIAKLRLELDSWRPPTKIHEEGLAKLMRAQLDQLADYEGNVAIHDRRVSEIERDEPSSGADERKAMRKALEASIARSVQRIADVKERTKSQNEWLEALRKSLPRPADEWGGK